MKFYLCKRHRDDRKRLKGCTLMCVWSCLLALWTCLAKLLHISSESRPREVVPDLGFFFSPEVTSGERRVGQLCTLCLL